MNVDLAAYDNAEGTTIRARIDGQIWFIPVDEGNEVYRAVIASRVSIDPYVPPVPPTVDQRVDEAAQRFLEQDLQMKALGFVLADVIERSFGVSKAVARQEVATRFKTYYKALLQEQT